LAWHLSHSFLHPPSRGGTQGLGRDMQMRSIAPPPPIL
jgi:hypothetical protein